MSDTKSPTYQIAVTEEQAEILVRALDIYTRLGLGQFEKVVDVYDHPCKLDLDVRTAMEAVLKAAKAVTGHPSNGSWGIHNPKVDDGFRVAFDLTQVIRHRLAWDRTPTGGNQVTFDKPRQIGGLPLAKMVKET